MDVKMSLIMWSYIYEYEIRKRRKSSGYTEGIEAISQESEAGSHFLMY